MSKIQKIFLTALLILLIGVGTYYLYSRQVSNSPTRSTNDQTQNSTKIRIAASIYPIGEFARQIGADLVEVNTITPVGQEPHDFEPTARQVQEIKEQVDLLILNGSGIDPWAEKLSTQLTKPGAQTLTLSNNISLLPALEDEHSHESEEHEEGDKNEIKTDPHIWLDPVIAQQQVEAIAQLIIQKYPSKTDSIQNYKINYINQLKQLDQDYASELSQCRLKTIITAHNAFQYLGKRYGFDIVSISGISPEQEPSTKDLAEISTKVKQLGIKHIFVESLLSPKLSETIARETGAQTLELNPLESLSEEQIQAGANYVSIMRSNLSNLKTAMQCQ